jgi:hypothetical protein
MVRSTSGDQFRIECRVDTAQPWFLHVQWKVATCKLVSTLGRSSTNTHHLMTDLRCCGRAIELFQSNCLLVEVTNCIEKNVWNWVACASGNEPKDQRCTVCCRDTVGKRTWQLNATFCIDLEKLRLTGKSDKTWIGVQNCRLTPLDA